MEQCSQAFAGRDSQGYLRSASSGGGGGAPGAGSASMLSQDKLYKVFQAILGIKSIEHQVLYRECQVGVV